MILINMSGRIDTIFPVLWIRLVFLQSLADNKYYYYVQCDQVESGYFFLLFVVLTQNICFVVFIGNSTDFTCGILSVPGFDI